MKCGNEVEDDSLSNSFTRSRREGNSVGGVVEAVVRNVPSGLGSPVFDKLDAELAKACISLPAAKGFEVERPKWAHSCLDSLVGWLRLQGDRTNGLVA